MPSDYDRIREGNLHEYGHGTRHLAFLGKLYADRTHFIFELLQNAEDAGATSVAFRLLEDRLEARHDGRLFDERDVRGVCGIGRSTKEDDLTQIGKFGIGFKSVYAYTRSPEIHSGDEHFRIQDLVRPWSAQARPTTPKMTLFVFPFDRDDVPAATARQEIGEALKLLDPRALLFLRHVREITWAAGEEGTLLSEVEPCGRGRKVTLVAESGAHKVDEEWLILEREVVAEGGLCPPPVEIAYRIRTLDGKRAVEPLMRSPLVVFFPTEKETELGFLVQGPYRTTPARDNVPVSDAWNQRLVQETALLIVDSLDELKRQGLLTVGGLEALPIDADAFQGTMFEPVFEAVREALRNGPYLPSACGRFVAGTEARLARTRALRELLSGGQLQALWQEDGPLHWVTSEISQDTKAELWSYLRNEINIDEVAPDGFARRITGAFLQQQSDDWITRFYAFLMGQEALWRKQQASQWPANRVDEGSLRVKPIVRLEDGKHVIPFREDGLPAAFLPGDDESSFPTVKRIIAADEQALEFLKRLGLATPNLLDEVMTIVLPKYEASKIEVSISEHERDFKKIMAALAAASRDEGAKLKAQLVNVPFLIVKEAASGTLYHLTPTRAYFPTDELLTYFEGCPQIYFIEDELDDAEAAQLKALGVADEVRVKCKWPPHASLSWRPPVTLESSWGHHVQGLAGFDPEASIEGLEHALGHPTVERSRSVWNRLLGPHAHLIRGTVEYSTRQDFSGVYKRDQVLSRNIGTPATEYPWLPGSDGQFYRPSDLYPDDLAEGFVRNDPLETALQMKAPEDAQAESDDEIEEVADQLQVEPALLREFVAVARSDPEKARQFMALMAGSRSTTEEKDEQPPQGGGASQVTGRTESSAGPGAMGSVGAGDEDRDSGQGTIADSDAPVIKQVDFDRGLRDAFTKPGRSQLNGVAASPAPLRDPQQRLQREREEVRRRMEDEPSLEQRFRRVSRQVWEDKDPIVRVFLEEEYGGRCQICGSTFPKRDGRPYFEGLYLVSRLEASWLDQPGNVICLCATCCAKFEHGDVQPTEDVVDQLQRDGPDGTCGVRLQLCGEPKVIRFSERHTIAVRALLAEASVTV